MPFLILTFAFDKEKGLDAEGPLRDSSIHCDGTYLEECYDPNWKEIHVTLWECATVWLHVNTKFLYVLIDCFYMFLFSHLVFVGQ